MVTALVLVSGAGMVFTGNAQAKHSGGSGGLPYTCTVTQNGVASAQSFQDDAAEDHWEALYGPDGGTCTGD
ncbi:MAG TPA: hypothetical protein VF898_10860 [Chloroflexota bacterium]